MKTETQIQRRLRQRHFRVQKRVLDASLRRSHRNCTYNVEALTSYGGIACVCIHPELTMEGSYDVEVGRLTLANAVPRFPACDSEEDQAPTCHHFEPRHSKEVLQERYKLLMTEVSANTEKFAEGFPDMAQLAWVLELTNGDVGSQSDFVFPLEEDPSEDETQSKSPFAKALDQTLGAITPLGESTDGCVTDEPAVEGIPAANSAKSETDGPTVLLDESDPDVVTTVVSTTQTSTEVLDIPNSWWRRLIKWALKRWQRMKGFP